MSYTDRRIIEQYRYSPLLISLFEVLIDSLLDEFLPVMEMLSKRLSIDEMEGVQLDYIGAIVGLKRPPLIQAEVDYLATVFTFSSNTSVQTSNRQGFNAGRFTAEQTFPLMPDVDYRPFLKAKIIKNNSRSTLLDCQRVAQLLLGDGWGVTEYAGSGAPFVQFFGFRKDVPAFFDTLKLVAPVPGGVPINYTDLT